MRRLCYRFVTYVTPGGGEKGNRFYVERLFLHTRSGWAAAKPLSHSFSMYSSWLSVMVRSLLWFGETINRIDVFLSSPLSLRSIRRRLTF